MPDDATRFAIGARMHYECAVAADSVVGMRPGYEISAPQPVMLLLGFSIELSLKSALLRAGLTLTDMKQIGHDLVSAYTRFCEVTGRSPLSSDHICQLELVSELHGDDFSLRYYARPKGGKFPVFGPLCDLAKKCMELCKAPHLEEIVVR